MPNPTNFPDRIANVDFWAGRIAALIKLAEHYGMTVNITGDELVVSRQVSEAFIAQTEVRWRAESGATPASEAQQPETELLFCVCGALAVRDGDRWTHHPGSGDRCLYRPDARPRCPKCRMPHDLTPGSMGVRACASILANLAEEERRG